MNLFLSVGAKDSFGHHPIQTVFQAISLADELEIQLATSDSFECDSAAVPVDNTVTKAWRLAKEYIDPPKMRVQLRKFVPVQSGLGGGSSDAAGFLRGLVKLMKGKFGLEEAMEVAKAIGSDVPFFLVGGLAKGTGYGEILEPLPDGQRKTMVVVMPNAKVSTADAYAALDQLPRGLVNFPTESDFGANDFEAIAPKESLAALERLRSLGAWQSGLSGSGASVFGVFRADEEVEGTATVFRHENLGDPYVCHTLSRKESLWIS